MYNNEAIIDKSNTSRDTLHQRQFLAASTFASVFFYLLFLTVFSLTVFLHGDIKVYLKYTVC